MSTWTKEIILMAVAKMAESIYLFLSLSPNVNRGRVGSISLALPPI
jgi:hypothetical protein